MNLWRKRGKVPFKLLPVQPCHNPLKAAQESRQKDRGDKEEPENKPGSQMRAKEKTL